MTATIEITSDKPTAQLSYLTPRAITVHPRNPRHRAVADDEMVASITEHGLVQPLVVAVIEEAGQVTADDGTTSWSEGKYLLIGGHRRLSACKKAKLKEVPCVVRRDLDTEAAQIEAMILENSSRIDLSPVEEAEGYAALIELGHKQKDIARITGKSPKTVSERLKLLKLAKSTRDRVHKGQMTLDDAVALQEFADDPALTKKLEQAAAGPEFKYQLQRARQHKAAAADRAVLVAELLDAGATQLDKQPAASDRHERVWHNGRAHRPECLAFWTFDDAYNGPQVGYMCTDPEFHRATQAAETTAASQANQKAAAERRAVLEQQQRDEAAASAHRMSTIVDALGPDTFVLPTPLVDLLRATLPALLHHVSYENDTPPAYMDLAGIIDEDRWANTWQPAERTKFDEHLDDISTGDVKAGRTLVALLVAVAESFIEDKPYDEDEQRPAVATAYLDTLDELGHEWSPVDLELRRAHGHLEADPEPAAEPEAT